MRMTEVIKRLDNGWNVKPYLAEWLNGMVINYRFDYVDGYIKATPIDLDTATDNDKDSISFSDCNELIDFLESSKIVIYE